MSRFSSTVRSDVDEIVRDIGAPLQRLGGTTLLVTGANGFFCSYFVDTVAALNDQGLLPRCQVIALDNLRVGLAERLGHLAGRADIQLIEHDVTQPLDIQVDWIIHGASIASPVFYRRYPLETIDANVSGTRQMLELARRTRVQGILCLSTSEIYGDPDPAFIPTNEEYRGNVSCTGPRACYDESKRLAETLCTTYHRLYDVSVKIVRPFNIYGPGQNLDDGRIIPDLMSSALGRKPIVLYGDGSATRAFCYVSDAIRAVWHVLLSDVTGEAFNVGNDQEEVAIRALAERFKEIVGPPWMEIEHHVSADTHFVTDNPHRRCPDLTKLRSRFPWRPQISLTQGLRRTLDSYLELRSAIQLN